MRRRFLFPLLPPLLALALGGCAIVDGKLVFQPPKPGGKAATAPAEAKAAPQKPAKRHNEGIAGSAPAIAVKTVKPPHIARKKPAAPRIPGPKPEPSPPVYTDVWERIRAGFAMPDLDNKSVRAHEKWYSSRQQYLLRVAKRARRYMPYIVEEIDRRGLPMELALLPVVESAYNPHAYSFAHASGLWQFIRPTGLHYGLKQNWWYDGRRDVKMATKGALDYLEFLHEKFDGDWFHALAAYNAGEGGIARAIRRNKKKGLSHEFHRLKLQDETRHYVPKLIAMRAIVADPAGHGVVLPPIANKPYFATLPTGGQLDLLVFAERSGIAVDEIQKLNPAFRRWATDPEGPHEILVPVEYTAQARHALATLDPAKRMRTRLHHIEAGESLSVIAHRYGVTTQALRDANQLSGDLIRAGRRLVVPLSSGRIIRAAAYRAQTVAHSGSGSIHVHTVRNGDTLWDIARKYGTNVAKLRSWNSIHNVRLLKPGQKIKVYR